MPTVPAVGLRFGRYEILAPLGAGGMGEVYRARDHDLGRDVAIKFLSARFAGDAARLARFEQEARTASALNHPNIITIYEIGDLGGTPYLVMEHIEGETLRRLIDEGRLPHTRQLEIAAQIAEGLAKAHKAGIVHRDLKPENVMTTADGFVKILDFGLAKLRPEGAADSGVGETVTQVAPRTVEGTILGTVGYMSPEQAAGRPVDARSDQFALGTIIYEMATGRRAFDRDSVVQTLAAIIAAQPEPIASVSPTFPVRARAIVERCLAKEPGARYESTTDLARDLRATREQLSQPSAPIMVPASPVTTKAPRPRARRWTVAGLAAALLIAAIVGGVRDLVTPRVESVAVLPFENLTGDSTQEYFVDGITDGLIGHLGRISALRVVSYYSVMRYKDGKTPIPQIANTLSADALVQGAVQEVGSSLKIRVRLIEPLPEERTLWESTYTRTLTDVIGMYSDVARAISREVGVAVQPAEEARLAGARPVNPKTYEAYLKGMSLLNGTTSEEFQRGLAILEQAANDDPGDPLTHVGVADAYVTLGHGPASPPDAWQHARQATDRALELDPNMAEAYADLADVKLYYERDWKGAEQNFRRAMELNPNLPMNHYHYAWYLALFSRFDEAIAEHKRARELDPLTPLYTCWLGGLYNAAGDYDSGLEEAQECLELSPRMALGWLIAGEAYAGQGKFDEAVAAHKKAVALDADARWNFRVARTYAAAGKQDEARKIQAEIERLPVTPFIAHNRAHVAAALGDCDEAFRWLNYRPAHAFVPWFRVGDVWKPLRSDPRFKAQLREWNLPDVE